MEFTVIKHEDHVSWQIFSILQLFQNDSLLCCLQGLLFFLPVSYHIIFFILVLCSITMLCYALPYATKQNSPFIQQNNLQRKPRNIPQELTKNRLYMSGDHSWDRAHIPQSIIISTCRQWELNKSNCSSQNLLLSQVFIANYAKNFMLDHDDAAYSWKVFRGN